ncbi:MAG: hypothetical protein A4S09_12755 [Proteobacteria bacterium SG_bin7]|nr:MAG: hypothetical protein A4S09_12755 [Proteobacteria bacterium SG_bin7]
MNKKVVAFLLVASNIRAAPILVFGDRANQVDFVRFREKHQNHHTFIDEEMNRLKKNASDFHVRDHFIDGKSDLLKGKAERAKSSFFELVSKSQKADWDETDHALITHAFLNLAEISMTEPEKKYWATRALAFSLGEIPEFGHLSNTLQKLLIEIKDNGTAFSLDRNLFLRWEKVLINGKTVTLSSINNLKIVPDSYRITLLSNRYLTQTLTLHSSQFGTLSPENSTLVFGSCDNPQLQSQVDKKRKYLVLFSEDCERTWDNGWDVVKNLKLLPDYKVINSMEALKERDSFFKSKWFWGGVILVGTILLANQSSDSSIPATPTPPQSVLDEED